MSARCDFCYEPDPEPAWSYACRDFTVEVPEISFLGPVMGAWLACRACHDLIEADDYTTLSNRATDEHIRRRTATSAIATRLAGPEYRAALLDALTNFHLQFKALRTGPAKRMTPPVPAETRPEYIAAMERQLSWLGFHRSAECEAMWSHMDTPRAAWDVTAGPSAGVRVGDRMRDQSSREAYRRVLEYGDVFYVSAPISQLIYASATSLPDATFSMSMLPARTGFVVFDDPVEMPSLSAAKVIDSTSRFHSEIQSAARKRRWGDTDFPIFFNALGWTPTDDGGVEFVLFTDGEVLQRKGYWPLSYFGFKDGETYRPHVERFERAALEDHEDYVAGEARPHEITFTMAMLLFMNQRVLVERRAAMPRATRRRGERMREEPSTHVQIITLRRYSVRSGETDEHPTEWHYQWAVRGHWRQQPYPTQGVVRPIWISAFTKGPEGKPFKDARRVFAVTR